MSQKVLFGQQHLLQLSGQHVVGHGVAQVVGHAGLHVVGHGVTQGAGQQGVEQVDGHGAGHPQSANDLLIPIVKATVNANNDTKSFFIDRSFTIF